MIEYGKSENYLFLFALVVVLSVVIVFAFAFRCVRFWGWRSWLTLTSALCEGRNIDFIIIWASEFDFQPDGLKRWRWWRGRSWRG